MCKVSICFAFSRKWAGNNFYMAKWTLIYLFHTFTCLTPLPMLSIHCFYPFCVTSLLVLILHQSHYLTKWCNFSLFAPGLDFTLYMFYLFHAFKPCSHIPVLHIISWITHLPGLPLNTHLTPNMFYLYPLYPFIL